MNDRFQVRVVLANYSNTRYYVEARRGTGPFRPLDKLTIRELEQVCDEISDFLINQAKKDQAS